MIIHETKQQEKRKQINYKRMPNESFY